MPTEEGPSPPGGSAGSTSENPTVRFLPRQDRKRRWEKGPSAVTISGMNPVTTYHVRAYATNEVGIFLRGGPVVYHGHCVAWSVNGRGLFRLEKRGFLFRHRDFERWRRCHGARGLLQYSQRDPHDFRRNRRTTATELGQFSGQLEDLLPGTTFYLRAWAKNAKGTGYGAQKTFTTVAGNEDLFATYGVWGLRRAHPLLSRTLTTQ